MLFPSPLQLHCNSVGGASLDNDPFSLCDRGDAAPSPLPAALALTAAAVRLFGVLFPHIISAQRYHPSPSLLTLVTIYSVTIAL